MSDILQPAETKQREMLYSSFTLQLCLVWWASAQAPGDGDDFCLSGGALGHLHPVYPDNIRVLMDSRDYFSLLNPTGNEMFTPRWQQVDSDDNNDEAFRTTVSLPVKW